MVDDCEVPTAASALRLGGSARWLTIAKCQPRLAPCGWGKRAMVDDCEVPTAASALRLGGRASWFTIAKRQPRLAPREDLLKVQEA